MHLKAVALSEWTLALRTGVLYLRNQPPLLKCFTEYVSGRNQIYYHFTQTAFLFLENVIFYDQNLFRTIA